MRKFTLPHATDSDSNKSAFSSQGITDAAHENELPKITTLNILFPELNKWTTLRVIGDALLLDIKKKLVKTFAVLLDDAYNMGLFQPSEGVKMGKYLEEERLLSEYTGDKTELDLEFVRKQRLGRHRHVTESVSKEMRKAFLRYVSRGDHRKVGSILAKGFDPNFHCPKTGETPLTLAVLRPKPHAMISALVAGGAHRDLCAKNGLTALHKAAAGGHFEAVKSLLDFGQSPNTVDHAGLTPLYHNILHDQDTKICHILLYEHSILGVCDQDGLQEIHQAARFNRIEHINLLIMYGVDVNARCTPPTESSKSVVTTKSKPVTKPGDTPLHVAASAGQRAAVVRLLSWGADPSLTNVANQTAIQVASACGYGELAETIRLFRGNIHDNNCNEHFLPTPSYNPKRRMRGAPANSYITEPTTLSTFPIFSANCRSRTTNGIEFTKEVATTQIKESGDTGMPHSPPLMHRTVSMGNLAPMSTAHAVLHQDLGSVLPRVSTDRQMVTQNACSPFIVASQVYYDSLRDATTMANVTLARKSKVTAHQQDNKYGGLPMYPSQCGIQGLHVTPQETRHFSRLIRPDIQNNAEAETIACKAIQYTQAEFQRDCSRPDSGISNSSAEKQSHSPTCLNIERNRKIILVNDRRNRLKESSVALNASMHLPASNSECNRLRPSFSCSDGKTQWKLLEGQISQGANPSIPTLTSAVPILHVLPRTVVLQKVSNTNSGIGEGDSSFGFSIRTAKHPELIAKFHPTTEKPSLQSTTHIVKNMPAYNAGIREGDFVLKVNGIDVTRFSHEEMVNCLSAAVADSVCLTITSPQRNNPKSSKLPSEIATVLPYPSSVVVDNNSKAKFNDFSTKLTMPLRQSTLQPELMKHPQHSVQSPDERAMPSLVTAQNTRMTQFSTSSRPSEESRMSSTRSSDRTNDSSFQDEGIWSLSTGLSSNNASGSDRSGNRLPLNVCDASRPPAGETADDHNPRIDLVHKRSMTRSRTISGIAETSREMNKMGSVARSLYFARNPRLHRIGSQDSRTSLSPGDGTRGTEVPHSTTKVKSTVADMSSVPSHGDGRYTQVHPVQSDSTTTTVMITSKTPKVTLIRAERKLPKQKATTIDALDSQTKLRMYPAHRIRTPSLNNCARADVNHEAIILPPAQFR